MRGASSMDHSPMKAFLLFLGLLTVMVFSQYSHAAYTATPTIEGLTGGTYKPLTIPSLTGANFSATGKVLINGKLVSIPGYVPPAATASQAAKTSLWLNPWLIGATLLAWADDAGLQSDYVNGGGWLKTVPGVGSASCTTFGGVGYGNTYDAACTASIARLPYQCPTKDDTGNCVLPGAVYGVYGAGWVTYYKSKYCASPECVNGAVYGDYMYDYVQHTAGSIAGVEGQTGGTTEPATQADFDALPAPSPQALAELAPQVGVPVDAPVYNPLTIDVGSPYTRADGSTAQPKARVSPAGEGQVTIDLYDQPLTNPDGSPVPADTPVQDTVEQVNQCELYPDSVGCAKFGTSPAMDTIPTTEILATDATAIGGAGSCPADIALPRGLTWSFGPMCDFATTIKPLILGFAWLSFGVIVAGGVRR